MINQHPKSIISGQPFVENFAFSTLAEIDGSKLSLRLSYPDLEDVLWDSTKPDAGDALAFNDDINHLTVILSAETTAKFPEAVNYEILNDGELLLDGQFAVIKEQS